MLIGLIVLLGVGILFFVFGWLLWKKQRIDLVHAWHTRNVKKRFLLLFRTVPGILCVAKPAESILSAMQHALGQTNRTRSILTVAVAPIFFSLHNSVCYLHIMLSM